MSPLASAKASSSNTRLEWSVRVCCKQYEVGGSFSVFVFLGHIPAIPEEWLMDPAFAGTVDALVDDPPEDDAGQPDFGIRGFVHLNSKFIERSGQDTLEPSAVVPYLRQNLNWGIQKVSGEVVVLEKVPSLEVTVLVTPLTLPPGAKFPTEGEPVYYHDVTRGRPGGYRGARDSRLV